MTANYDYWHSALAGQFGPVHDGDAQPGFWRKRTKRGGPFVPVAIFEHNGEVVALVDGKPTEAAPLWTFVCREPVTEEAYHTKMAGGLWPDEDQSIADMKPPAVGHNNAPKDPAEMLKEEIENALAGVKDYAEINDDETSARALSKRNRLLELSGDADKKREALKKPHLDAGREIDGLWQPLVRAAKAGADAIRAAMSAHETRKFQSSEKARLEAEEAARKAAPPPAPVKGAPATPPPPAAPAPAPVTKITAAYGRAASKTVVKIATVTDQDKAYSYLRTHPEMVTLITQLAQRAVTAGYSDIPGVAISEEVKVR